MSKQSEEYQGRVYEMQPAAGENHPSIDFEQHGYWDEWAELERPFPPGVDTQHSVSLAFSVDHPEATAWDWYYGANDGLFSSRACDALWPWLRACSNRFAVALNGETYYIINDNGKTVDCLDVDASKFVMFKSGPPTIKEAECLRFIRSKLQDPMIFRLPQYGAILATEAVRQRVADANLRGFEFIDCEALRGYL